MRSRRAERLHRDASAAAAFNNLDEFEVVSGAISVCIRADRWHSAGRRTVRHEGVTTKRDVLAGLSRVFYGEPPPKGVFLRL
jgi:hypothetical protein